MQANALIKPQLPEPFPDIPEIWTDPITNIKIPKRDIKRNIEWRRNMLTLADKDPGMQAELLAACKESVLFWVNAFVWTFHQFETEGKTGRRSQSEWADVPMITWEVQDRFFLWLEDHLANARDAAAKKSREMGASWCCAAFIHHKWLFRPNSQMLEMSRTREYVDQKGNMKALFQKHDYMNDWLPTWMRPPGCLYGQENRTMMHMKNVLNGSCIDGESTTEHAASGDRRLIILLDEFAKVKFGAAMRSATRDAALMRIVNSTPAGAGTEYSRWINDGTIDVFPLMFWDHPDKGVGRHAVQDTTTSEWKIISPWYEEECKCRSPREIAQEVDAVDIESGQTFFTISNIDKHEALHARPPLHQIDLCLRPTIAENVIKDMIHQRKVDAVQVTHRQGARLSLWCDLPGGRPDQTKTYRFGIDLGRGQGASPSVVSILCEQTGQKVGEWVCARTPPYEMGKIVVALAIWFGGSLPQRLPFLTWEMNGPGWDFSRVLVQTYQYPNFYRQIKKGKVSESASKTYGVHMDADTKKRILYAYDRKIATGEYVNPSARALAQARMYVHYETGGCGPAELTDATAEEKKEHGDIVIADALSIDFDKAPKIKKDEVEAPEHSHAGRKKIHMAKVKPTKAKSWRKVFDYV